MIEQAFSAVPAGGPAEDLRPLGGSPYWIGRPVRSPVRRVPGTGLLIKGMGGGCPFGSRPKTTRRRGGSGGWHFVRPAP
jgi:hypothetical protein